MGGATTGGGGAIDFLVIGIGGLIILVTGLCVGCESEIGTGKLLVFICSDVLLTWFVRWAELVSHESVSFII